MPIQHDTFEAISFGLEMTPDGSALEIRFASAHSHETIVTMSRQVAEELATRATLLLSKGNKPLPPH